MATLVVQTTTRAGLEPVYIAADAEGDDFVNSGKEFIHIKNGDSSFHTVTIITPSTVDGLAVADRAVTIPVGEERIIGPFPAAVYNEAGSTSLTYDAVTSLTLGLFKVGA